VPAGPVVVHGDHTVFIACKGAAEAAILD
jgi:hypothetical protein